MPKVARTRKFRAATTATKTSPETSEPQTTPLVTTEPATSLKPTPATGQSQLSRGQRKRQAKRDKYLRREKLVLSSLKLKAQDEQAKRIDGLDAIKDALLETVKTSLSDKAKEATKKKQPPPSLLKTNHGRKKLVDQEVTQMKLVLEHPAFVANPMATIREHLQNSIEPVKASSAVKPKASPEKVKRKRHKTKYRAQRSKRR